MLSYDHAESHAFWSDRSQTAAIHIRALTSGIERGTLKMTKDDLGSLTLSDLKTLAVCAGYLEKDGHDRLHNLPGLKPPRNEKEKFPHRREVAHYNDRLEQVLPSVQTYRDSLNAAIHFRPGDGPKTFDRCLQSYVDSMTSTLVAIESNPTGIEGSLETIRTIYDNATALRSALLTGSTAHGCVDAVEKGSMLTNPRQTDFSRREPADSAKGRLQKRLRDLGDAFIFPKKRNREAILAGASRVISKCQELARTSEGTYDSFLQIGSEGLMELDVPGPYTSPEIDEMVAYTERLARLESMADDDGRSTPSGMYGSLWPRGMSEMVDGSKHGPWDD